MPPVNMLIKPASSACNLRCKYCFYNAIATNRKIADTGILKDEMLEMLVIEALSYADGYCSFAFQGGEPTLAGISFFRKLIEFQKKYNSKNVLINNAIQTNGYIIDDEWAKFLADNNFLVGISLDGPKEIHDLNRKNPQDEGSFSKVMEAISCFNRHNVQYNILSVVTGLTARKIEKVYNFYKKNGFRYLQFIPCLEPLENERGSSDFFLSADRYAKFLCHLFDLWLADFKMGKYISIRYFDNLVHMILGRPPEACNMNGTCSIQLVVEGDGGVYPCDFYVYDKWRIGTIGKDSIAEIVSSEKAVRFIEESAVLPEKCLKCEYVALCRNGCKRDRVQAGGNQAAMNFYCDSYKAFFAHALPGLKQAAYLAR